MTVRIIARLDMKPPVVIKPVHFEGYRRIGAPGEVAARYDAQGADELLCEDVVASLFDRGIQADTMREAAQAGWIPVTLGGGVRTMADCEQLFACGADKVAINTAAVHGDGSLLRTASRVFGPQSVVVHVTARRTDDGWLAMTDMGRIESRWNAVDWVREAEQLGAGEIIVSSVDRDGRRNGFDIALIRAVVDAVGVPVVAASGAGSVDDVVAMVRAARPSAVAIGSLLHYGVATVSDVRAALAADDAAARTRPARSSLAAATTPADGVRHAA